MTRVPPFEQIVDYCVEDITSGRATVEECLAAWPEYRDELAPILEAASTMHAAPRIPERPANAARRNALMIAIGQTPQEPRSRWLPGLSLPRLAGGAAMRFATATAPVAAVALIAALLLFGQFGSQASAATLTVFDGDAEVYRDGGWHPLFDGDRLDSGMRVRTAADAYAMITFDDGSTISLDPATELAIEHLDVDAGGPREVVLRLNSGRAWHDVAPSAHPASRYEVVTPDGVIRAGGPVFETTVIDRTTSVIAASGFVRLHTGGQDIPVARGELARARDGELFEHRAAAELDNAIVVRAPFAATLVSDRGEATGVSTDGVVLRQLRGVTTTRPGAEPQRFSLHGIEDGTYTLLLQRVDSGDGVLLLHAEDGPRTIELETESAAYVELDIVVEHGAPRITLLNDEAEEIDPAEFSFRVVETARTRSAEPLLQPATPATSPAPAETPTPVPDAPPAPPADPPAATPEPDRPSGPDHAGTPGLPDFVRAIETERETFRQQLVDAVEAEDAVALAALLNGIVEEDDPAILRARLGVLAQYLEQPRLAAQLRAVLDTEATPGPPGHAHGLRNRLGDAMEHAGPPAALDRLERALGQDSSGRGPGRSDSGSDEGSRRGAGPLPDFLR